MAVKFQDYYETLGVARSATQDEIQRAYRKLARQYHPDVNKAKDAEGKFKLISEAYEVLKDPEKRKRYDTLGANWKAGQEFTPPPGWGQAGRAGGFNAGPGGFSFKVGGTDGGDFSDFFETFFGRGGAFRESMGHGGFDPDDLAGFAAGRPSGPHTGHTLEADLTITLEDAYHGTTRQVTLRGDNGGGEKTLQVKIPAGTTDGTAIRLAGQGAAGSGGGDAGDLILRVRFAEHPFFELAEGDPHSLVAETPVAPWEAALGAKVNVHTLDGDVTLSIPPGTQPGQRLRLRGKGLPKRSGERGDLYAKVVVAIPKILTPRMRELFEAMKKESESESSNENG